MPTERNVIGVDTVSKRLTSPLPVLFAFDPHLTTFSTIKTDNILYARRNPLIHMPILVLVK
jgi:hypothetical protein